MPDPQMIYFESVQPHEMVSMATEVLSKPQAFSAIQDSFIIYAFYRELGAGFFTPETLEMLRGVVKENIFNNLGLYKDFFANEAQKESPDASTSVKLLQLLIAVMYFEVDEPNSRVDNLVLMLSDALPDLQLIIEKSEFSEAFVLSAAILATIESPELSDRFKALEVDSDFFRTQFCEFLAEDIYAVFEVLQVPENSVFQHFPIFSREIFQYYAELNNLELSSDFAEKMNLGLLFALTTNWAVSFREEDLGVWYENNIGTVLRLEQQSPGICNRLSELFGISCFARYSDQFLLDQDALTADLYLDSDGLADIVVTRENMDEMQQLASEFRAKLEARDLLLTNNVHVFICASADWTGAFSTYAETLEQIRASMPDGHLFLAYEVGSVQQLMPLLKSLKIFSNLQTVFLMAHGNANEIVLSDADAFNLKLKDIARTSSPIAAELQQLSSSLKTLVLGSCEAGKAFANKFYQILGEKVEVFAFSDQNFFGSVGISVDPTTDLVDWNLKTQDGKSRVHLRRKSG